MALLVLLFHDGEKCRLEYGDTVYVNVAPPFPAGFMLPQVEDVGIIKLVPNMNLPYKDKIEFFIFNYDKIDAAVMLSSALLTQVKPRIGKNIRLKGLLALDSVIADVNIEEIKQFVGVTPKTTYSSTEMQAPSVPSLEHPLGFIFDWRRNIIELHPISKGKISPETLVGLDSVDVGEVYQPVYTSLEGELTRYVIEDSIKCIAKGDSIIGSDYPVFKFHSRIGGEISLQNFTRITEDDLVASLRSGKVSFIDFVAKPMIDGCFEYLVIYLEHTCNKSSVDIAHAIHKYLYENDADYGSLVDFFGYLPIRVRAVPRGSSPDIWMIYKPDRSRKFP
ncbi:MAG: GH3 auxin-responsive promoter family protein [Candidatus Bathyarchaeota archaeon]|nr:GH3 auxin-responsive promoter family protein [Candidatus Bathyarchaeota archaeon]